MRILVTGGYGYVGGRLVAALAESGHEVRAGSRRRRPESRAVAMDFADPAGLEAAAAGMEVVVHLAAMNERDSAARPEAALEANGLATLSLLDAAERAGVRRFVYASTAKVFGNNPVGALDESCLPRPASHYAITHRLAEDYVLARHDQGRIEGVVLRLSNALGAPADPAVDAWMLISNDLCRSAALDGRVVLRSSGLAWRNFVTMADVVSAFGHAATMPSRLLGDGLFHLGGPKSRRIIDLARLVAARAGGVAVAHAAPGPDESHPDLDWRIGRLAGTGWAPLDDLDHEIDSTLAFCRRHFGPAVG